MNLLKRGSLVNPDNLSCGFCDSNEENASHCFFILVLLIICGWGAIDGGISWAIHSDPLVNLLVQQKLLKVKKGKKVAITIWLGMVWIIWK